MVYSDKNVRPGDYDQHHRNLTHALNEFQRNWEFYRLCPKGLKAVDLGGGVGILSAMLGATLVEWSDEGVKMARQYFPELAVIQADIGEYLKSASGKFELVLLTDVLEEMPASRTEEVLSGIDGVTEPGAYFLISTPTHENYLTLSTHQVIYTRQELLQMLSNHGWSLENEARYPDRLVGLFKKT